MPKTTLRKQPAAVTPANYILLVEDVAETALFLEALILQRWPGRWRVHRAQTVPAARVEISKERPAWALVDHWLPGVETSAELIEELLSEGTPVISMTGLVSPPVIERCNDPNWMGWVAKPALEGSNRDLDRAFLESVTRELTSRGILR